jgi:hypothetical protein
LAFVQLRGGDKVIIGLLSPIIFIALIIVVVRKLTSAGGRGGLRGLSVRRFFQYLLLYCLIIISAIGLSGLLGRLLDRSTLVAADQTDLARSVSFVVVGIPLYIFVALWTRRRFLTDPSEAKSFGWSFYITLANITSLVMAMFALYETLTWAFGIHAYSGYSIARLVVWGTLWCAHWRLDVRLTPKLSSRSHHLIGSLIGLGTAVVGLINLIGAVIERALKLGGDVLFVGSPNPIVKSAITLAVAIPVWFLYWVRTYSKSKRDPLWLAYVLLVGVGGGLVVAISCASTVLYSVLVWFLGQPRSLDASMHFQNTPSIAAAACVGVVLWWYHHAVLDDEITRTEIRRIYEYLMAGIGLLGAAAGLTMILVALLETISSSSVITGGSGARNALLAAATLLLVGTPVWWIFWQRIQSAKQKFSYQEHASPSRRIYLFLLFGIGGLTAVIVLLIGVFFLFDDIFKGNLGLETLHRARFCLGILITTGAVAGYHWVIYRVEREQVAVGQHGPSFVLLIGPKDPELIQAVTYHTGGRVQAWKRMDDDSKFGSVEEALAILDKTQEESIILLADSDGVRAIPVEL